VPDQPVGPASRPVQGRAAPVLLAIDTTREFGSLALARGEAVIEELSLHEPSGFAHVLYSHLDALLRRNQIRLDAIDCFAAASGPGSFTGVRVGLACIKGLAEALGKPAFAVSSLQALSCFGAAPLRAPLLDARRGELYGAVYDEAATLVMPEVVAKLDAWLPTLPPAVEFVALAPISDLRSTLAPAAQAGAIARLAARRFFRGEASDPALLDANYVRRSDAELFWKD
jgi:tRNA threonylcarbamoyladenosine biosynthesis protein TsaB